MNYLQLDKCTILKYSPLHSSVMFKRRLGVIQGHWNDVIR